MAMQELILGIESSCDDTAVAIVDRAGNVISSHVAGQEYIHREYGGIYPEYASRAHAMSIFPAIERTLDIAGVAGEELTAIGVTRGPGLIGSLQVGLNAAVALGFGWSIPVVGVNHLRGHLRSADLEGKRVDYPALVLLVSGGHTFLAFMLNPTDVRLLGTTRDDSIGEAYDKVARMLNLGFPGGPAIDREAIKGTPTIKFPRPMLQNGYEFSFSGLKSSVARYIEKNPLAATEDVCASFVEACLDVIVAKVAAAAIEFRPKSVVAVGGVAASRQLRERLGVVCNELVIRLCLPPLRWSTDNGAMIALAAWDYLDVGVLPELIAETRIPLARM